MTKDDVLALLEQAGAPVSGEQMCKTLGLTRAAVWKAIEALRADGYEIEAATRRGYFLCTCPLTKSALEKRLAGQFPAERLIVLPEVDSTNNYLKTLAANGASDGTAVLSLKQTAGRGRRGRSFLSEPGGLYLSFLMRPQEPAEALLHLTALAGLCVCTAVKQVTGMQAGIKWPNDPVLNGKKLCGILTELSVSLETQEPEYVVIGIGVNCNQKRFPEDLSMATSLRIEGGSPVDVNAVAAALLLELSRMSERTCRSCARETRSRPEPSALGKTRSCLSSTRTGRRKASRPARCRCADCMGMYKRARHITAAVCRMTWCCPNGKGAWI